MFQNSRSSEQKGESGMIKRFTRKKNWRDIERKMKEKKQQ